MANSVASWIFFGRDVQKIHIDTDLSSQLGLIASLNRFKSTKQLNLSARKCFRDNYTAELN